MAPKSSSQKKNSTLIESLASPHISRVKRQTDPIKAFDQPIKDGTLTFNELAQDDFIGESIRRVNKGNLDSFKTLIPATVGDRTKSEYTNGDVSIARKVARGMSFDNALQGPTALNRFDRVGVTLLRNVEFAKDIAKRTTLKTSIVRDGKVILRNAAGDPQFPLPESTTRLLMQQPKYRAGFDLLSRITAKESAKEIRASAKDFIAQTIDKNSFGDDWFMQNQNERLVAIMHVRTALNNPGLDVKGRSAALQTTAAPI